MLFPIIFFVPLISYPQNSLYFNLTSSILESVIILLLPSSITSGRKLTNHYSFVFVFSFNSSERYQVFIDLFNVASYLIPQRFLPKFNDGSNPFIKIATSQPLPEPVIQQKTDVIVVYRSPPSSKSESSSPDNTSSLLTCGAVLLIPLLALWMLMNLVYKLFSI